MPIMSYNTPTAAAKSCGEVQAILAAKGARSIAIDYENGNPVGLSFIIAVHGSDIAFKMPANWNGVLAALCKSGASARWCTKDQALRVAWRVLFYWTKAQLALIEAGQVTLAEVFLPYALTGSGETMGQRVLGSPERLLLAMGDTDPAPCAAEAVLLVPDGDGETYNTPPRAAEEEG